MTSEMYKENILDHYKKPRNFGELSGAQHHAHTANSLCGDELDFFLNFGADEKVAEVQFTGRGCTISMASASMLSEKLKGLKKSEIAELTNEEVLKFLGVPVNPARMRCATLALETVQRAVSNPTDLTHSYGQPSP